MPTVSVIVPTRSRNHLLPRALDSLARQTFQDFEIILVDDNPPAARAADSPNVAPWLSDPRVRLLVHDAPKNAAAARNCGLEASRGEWVTYLDDDDAYHPEKIKKQLERARQTGLPLGLCGLAYNLSRRRRVRQVSRTDFHGADILLETVPDTKAIFHQAAPVRFDETLDAAEDLHFFFRLVRHFQTERVFNVPEPLIEVFPQPGPRVNLNADAQWRAILAVHREFAGAYGSEAARLFLARGRLQNLKYHKRATWEMVRLALALTRLTGTRDWRAILNAFLYRIPAARPFLVS